MLLPQPGDEEEEEEEGGREEREEKRFHVFLDVDVFMQDFENEVTSQTFPSYCPLLFGTQHYGNQYMLLDQMQAKTAHTSAAKMQRCDEFRSLHRPQSCSSQ